MKDISIGIYHKDHQYGKRLMEYLNHQKDFPMTASFTSDEEMFFKQEQEGDFRMPGTGRRDGLSWRFFRLPNWSK